MARDLVVLVSIISLSLGGCKPTSDPPDAMVGEIVPQTTETYQHGMILARDDSEIVHTFLLENPSERPLGIVDAVALTPCCSRIIEAPSSVPPGGSAAVRAAVKVAGQEGLKRADFELYTDATDRPIVRLSISFEAIPDLEIRRADGSDTDLLIGDSGRQRFSIICREFGTVEAPGRLRIDPPATAAFLGPARRNRLDGDIVEVSRDVEVALPAFDDPGSHRVELVVGLADGSDYRQPVTWRVRTRLQVHPAGLTLRRADGTIERSVIVSSADAPFRIIDVPGMVVASWSSNQAGEPSRSHILKLRLDPARAGSADLIDIPIVTDHADRDSAVLNVLLVPEEAIDDADSITPSSQGVHAD